MTESAVRAFQRHHRLAADGVVGRQTWKALRSAWSAAHRRAVPAPAQPLRSGANGRAVRELQRRLHVHADGAFGPATDHAVRAFQRKHHLRVDGVVGKQTWKAAIKGC